MASSYTFLLEPNWTEASTAYSSDEYTVPSEGIGASSSSSIMQTDSLKSFYLDIAKHGLHYTYKKYKFTVANPKGEPSVFVEEPPKKTAHPKKVVIVGAGLSGLVAGFELSKAGHHVEILEMQHRVGGRVKTVSTEKFYPGLWCEAGAMRIPGTGEEADVETKHYLTNYYAQVEFNLKTVPFDNTSNGFYYVKGQRFAIKDWNADPDKYCTMLWPGWDDTIKSVKEKHGIRGIVAYYNACIHPVMSEIRHANGGNPTAADWKKWVDRWSRISCLEFLTSTYDAIIQKIEPNETINFLEPLKELLPWNKQTLTGYQAYNHTTLLTEDLVESVRDDLGGWLDSPMYTLEGGMSCLAWAFTRGIEGVSNSRKIMFGMTVTDVDYTTSMREYPSVTIKGHNSTICTKESIIEGDVAILAVPLSVMRQVSFHPPLAAKCSDALMRIKYTPATKILLQCKTRFWEEQGIFGGCSFTDLPFGGMYYPTNCTGKPLNGRGILTLYSWRQNMHTLMADTEEMAIAKAVECVSKVHPEMKDNFEVGFVQAWHSEKSSQGAFTSPMPGQTELINDTFLYPYPNYQIDSSIKVPAPPSLYFAGEAISYTVWWIQGALESGLRAAYQFYSRNEYYYETNQSTIGGLSVE